MHTPTTAYITKPPYPHVYKWAIFREWHYEWLKPWAHYIPLSLKGDEWLEAVRWFDEDELGKKEAERVAVMSQDWANKVLRREDMEVWLYRLLLEYVLFFFALFSRLSSQHHSLHFIGNIAQKLTKLFQNKQIRPSH